MYLEIFSSVVWVDFITILLSKFLNFGEAIKEWYKVFGIVAVLSDCLIIVIGILLAKLFFPTYNLLVTSICIQIIHDLLFYYGVILPIPKGHNAVIDLFKKYAAENSYKIIIADSIMMGSTVLLAEYFSEIQSDIVALLGIIGVYAITYII